MFTGETELKDLPEVNELYHHGVKGQQWGVQNGPPYPLSKEDHNKVSKTQEKKKEAEKLFSEVSKLMNDSETHSEQEATKMLKEAMKKYDRALELEREFYLETGPDINDFSKSTADWINECSKILRKDLPEAYSEDYDNLSDDFWSGYRTKTAELADIWNNKYAKEGWVKYAKEPSEDHYDNLVDFIVKYENTDSKYFKDRFSRNPLLMRDQRDEIDYVKHSDHLEHHGILGQKWGDQNGPPYPLNSSQKSYSEKKQAKMDKKWIRKNDKKIRRYADSQSKDELKAYEKELRKVMPKYNKNGKINSNYATAYSKKMAELYNKAIGDLSVSSGSGSGKVVKFVAARGQMDVFTALADYGYDMSNVKNGVFNSGKIGYRKESVGVDHDERR